MSEHFATVKRALKRDVIQRKQMQFIFSPGSTMSTPDAAKMLGVSTTTVRKMIESDELKGYKNRPDRSSSPYRVFKDSVAKLMQRIVDDYNLHDVGAPSANPATPAHRTLPEG